MPDVIVGLPALALLRVIQDLEGIRFRSKHSNSSGTVSRKT